MRLWRLGPSLVGGVTSADRTDPVSYRPAASGLQIGLQHRRLICSSRTFTTFTRMRPLVRAGGGYPPRGRAAAEYSFRSGDRVVLRGIGQVLPEDPRHGRRLVAIDEAVIEADAERQRGPHHRPSVPG